MHYIDDHGRLRHDGATGYATTEEALRANGLHLHPYHSTFAHAAERSYTITCDCAEHSPGYMPPSEDG